VSSASLRPGFAQGLYPERSSERTGRLDRAAHDLRGWLMRRSGGLALDAVVARIRAHRRELGQPDAATFTARVEQLRERLVREGLRDELMERAFALISEAARRTLGFEHYDVQLMGGWLMAQGMLAEMQTGEGKTLTATLPACTAALAGVPVHVISANDYLVARDAESMRPIYEVLGLSVAAVIDGERDSDLRRAAYASDVTYGTTKQIAFDYLRDRLERGPQSSALHMNLERMHRGEDPSEKLLLRGLCYAVVDEADSVLIDEARTPLILSAQRSSALERRTYRSALRLANSLEQPAHFRMDPRSGKIQLTPGGQAQLEELARPLKGFWSGPRRREEWVIRALNALHLFERDKHYLVRDGKVQIIDGPTGRVSEDRSWENGLHQLIETKEGCEVTPERETLARISYQQFFRRYLRLSGMTGTASEVAPELWSVYGLRTQTVPTRRPVQRRNLGMVLLPSEASKWDHVVRRIRDVHRSGRPVLVGTCSVAASEHLSELLQAHGLQHQVLNARHDAEEARIVAQAGQPRTITVATNMAGRGTDIELGGGIAQRGGLHVISTQRSEAGRIDRQLYGRAGRQGDPGSFEAIYSLEDEPMRLHYPRWLLRLLAQLSPGGAALPAKVAGRLTLRPQRAEEARHARTRRALIDLEEYQEDLLAFSGAQE
jgi:preprotein translocase subunit SecA